MSASRKTVLTAISFLLVASPIARADEICLKSGRCFQGVIVERNFRMVTIDIGPGRIRLPADQITSLEESESALSVFRDKARLLSPNDVRGWLSLAHWAAARGLHTQASSAFERVLAVDPANSEANAALGNILVNDRWMPPEDAYRAQGYVFFEGAWMSREERDGRLEQRRIDAETAKVEAMRADAEARQAEAAAKAKAAEAASSTAAEAPQLPDGSWGWGIGAPCWGANCTTTVPVECAPYMDGPACASTTSTSRQEEPIKPQSKRSNRRHHSRSVSTPRESHSSAFRSSKDEKRPSR